MNTRPDWDDYFLGVAQAVAARADCRRRKVGAVIVDENHRIIGTGYNGSVPGGPSCLSGECPRGLKSNEEIPPNVGYHDPGARCFALHAEQNAVLFANASVVGATLYCTEIPCGMCANMIANIKIARVVTPFD